MITTTSTALSEEIEELALAHGLPCGPRKLLQPRHIQEFPDDSLFHRFARVVCRADKIPRKELFETWAMALQVQNHFPIITRFADLACGHGLVSWALLLLYANQHTNDSSLPLPTAVCIDIRMPAAADRLSKLMLEEWPELREYWDYVEGSVDGMIPSSSTLLVGVHACAQLSDKVVANAIYANAPLALVPCCHTKKSLTKEQQARLLQERDSFANLAEAIDSYRIERLEQVEMTVQQARLSDLITPKNRVILAKPSSSRIVEKPTPRLNPSLLVSKVSIPLDDTPDCREQIRSMAGREAAESRKAPTAPSMGLCLYLPPSGEDILHRK